MTNSTPNHRHATSEEDFVSAVRQLAVCWGARFIFSDSNSDDTN